jgi:hypothetical protein
MKTGDLVKIWTHHLMCPTTGEQLGYDETRFSLYMLLEKGYHCGQWDCINLETMKVWTIQEYEFGDVL